MSTGVKMTTLQQNAKELVEIWRRLHQRWQDAQAQWNDPVAHSFAKEHWALLEQQMHAVQQELERLAQVVAQAQRSVK